MAMKYENECTLQCIKEFGWERVRGGDFIHVDRQQHFYHLLSDTTLGNELCPIPVENCIDISQYQRCVYTLRLEGGKYFVSTTKHLNKAIASEAGAYGSEWTRIFKSEALIKVTSVNSDQDFREAHLTELKASFLEYGFANVRGGEFSLLHQESHRRMVFDRISIE